MGVVLLRMWVTASTASRMAPGKLCGCDVGLPYLSAVPLRGTHPLPPPGVLATFHSWSLASNVGPRPRSQSVDRSFLISGLAGEAMPLLLWGASTKRQEGNPIAATRKPDCEGKAA